MSQIEELLQLLQTINDENSSAREDTAGQISRIDTCITIATTAAELAEQMIGAAQQMGFSDRGEALGNARSQLEGLMTSLVNDRTALESVRSSQNNTSEMIAESVTAVQGANR